MKTAISVPDDTFERASQRARDLGMSRSEFFSRAAARYLDQLDSASVSHQIDVVLATVTDDPDGDSFDAAVAAGRRTLADVDDAW